MIIDKTLKIKITRKNIKHYTKFFTASLGEIIDIDVESHLQKNSNIKLNVECDICNAQRYIKFQAYTKNINSSVKYPIYTSDKCSHLKLKEYNKEHYGVEYYSQHPDRNDKVKKTSNEKYGVDHFSKSPKFKEKVSKTNLEKFGYENPFMDGDRIKTIFNAKYGVNHPSQVEEFNNKIKEGNLRSTGYSSALSSPDIRKKIRITNDIKYGGHPMLNEDIRYLNSIIARDRDYISYQGENISLFKCDVGHTFQISSDLYHNRLRSHLPLCTICYPLNENISIKECELVRFIRFIYSGKIITSYKDKLEIDVYLPELKIGFEFNGLYWHSSDQKNNNYHFDKTKYFEEMGIKIIHLWEDDWDYKSEIVKSQICNWIGVTKNKIYARKCQIVEITDSKLVSSFLNDNHIQGKANSIKKYGLFYNDELVSLMTFDKSEGRKKMPNGEWNLNRFCNKINSTVIGGASKLLNYFLNDVSPSKIISYADKAWSTGGLYKNMGFNKVSDIKSDYKYIIDNRRVHKSRYRKSRLKTNLSEANFTKSIGIKRIYDCGKIKFEKIYN